MTPETLAKYRDLLDGLKSGSRTVERVTHEVGDFFDDGTMLVTACEWDYKIRCKTLLDVKFMSNSQKMVRELIEEVERLTLDISSKTNSYNYQEKLQTQLEAQKKAIEWYDRIPCNESFHRLGGIDDCDPCKYKLEAKAILNEAGLG